MASSIRSNPIPMPRRASSAHRARVRHATRRLQRDVASAEHDMQRDWRPSEKGRASSTNAPPVERSVTARDGAVLRLDLDGNRAGNPRLQPDLVGIALREQHAHGEAKLERRERPRERPAEAIGVQRLGVGLGEERAHRQHRARREPERLRPGACAHRPPLAGVQRGQDQRAHLPSPLARVQDQLVDIGRVERLMSEHDERHGHLRKEPSSESRISGRSFVGAVRHA